MVSAALRSFEELLMKIFFCMPRYTGGTGAFIPPILARVAAFSIRPRQVAED
jgi:hypothetical protein